MSKSLKDIQRELVTFTKDCRDDMHEPDEQGISARVVGNHLDNAFGTTFGISDVAGSYQELVVILNKDSGPSCVINLATLIALARKAAL